MDILPELLDRMQLMVILVYFEDLVELIQIGDDIFDGNMTPYTLSEVVDSMFVFRFVGIMNALVGVLRPLSAGVRIRMMALLYLEVVVVLLHDVTILRYSFINRFSNSYHTTHTVPHKYHKWLVIFYPLAYWWGEICKSDHAMLILTLFLNGNFLTAYLNSS